jgi:hypothetical protein
MSTRRSVLALLLLGNVMLWSCGAYAGSDSGELATPAQGSEPRQQQAAGVNPRAVQHAIGGVALVRGSASVTRESKASTLKVSDAIFRGDLLQTAPDGTLGITFNDTTTFSLQPNSQITVDDFVYQERGKHNVAAFEIIKGTVSFVASAVAKTGDMKIGTPTAAIGIRGTTGIVEIRTAAVAGGPSEVSIKLYSDADGHVGTIEVFGRDGSQLGVLTGGATGFLVRIAAPGALQRFSAVPLQISPQELERDRGFVRQTFSVQQIGRRINLRRQNLLRQDRQLSPTPRLRRLNLLPPPTRSVGPTLLQPGTLPGRRQPDVPAPPQLPDNTLPPVTPLAQPLPGLPSPAPNLPSPPAVPRLPGRL